MASVSMWELPLNPVSWGEVGQYTGPLLAQRQEKVRSAAKLQMVDLDLSHRPDQRFQLKFQASLYEGAQGIRGQPRSFCK